MKTESNNVYVMASARIPFVKSQTAYDHLTRKELMIASLKALVDKAGLHGRFVGDTAIGAVMNSASDWNLARECLLSTDIDPRSPAYNIQRACGTGLEAAWQIALKAATGGIDLGIAGGVDTNSDLPIEVSDDLQGILLDLEKAKSWSDRLKVVNQFSLKSLKPKIPAIREPRTDLLMGDHCELMVKEWNIPREEQDRYAYESHHKAAKGFKDGFFNDLVVPFHGQTKDGTVRPDTTLEKLAKLPAAFDKPNGTLSAGNSSPLTDGSACVLLANDKGAATLGIKPLANIVDIQAAAVDFVHGDGLLMAPTRAIAQLLKRNNLSLQDFDYYEIHEAFAGQVLCTLKALESKEYCRTHLGLDAALGSIDKDKINLYGGSVALGHPFAATGARIVGTMAKLLAREKGKRGLISICTAGGMGVAAILESVK